MLIEHSENLSRLYESEQRFRIMEHRPRPQKISCPRLEALNLRLGFINDTKKQFQLDWGREEQVFEPLTISEGVITVKDASGGPGQEWILSLPSGSFPFAPRATLYSPPMPASSVSAQISIRISVVDVRIPRVDAKAITSSFAGLFPSHFSGLARLTTDSHRLHLRSLPTRSRPERRVLLLSPKQPSTLGERKCFAQQVDLLRNPLLLRLCRELHYRCHRGYNVPLSSRPSSVHLRRVQPRRRHPLIQVLCRSRGRAQGVREVSVQDDQGS